MFLRLSPLAPVAIIGLLYAVAPRAAVAVERPVSVERTMVVQPAASEMPAYYYYHGRRYPYRYNGMYYSHRYYRYGRYHYY